MKKYEITCEDGYNILNMHVGGGAHGRKPRKRNK